MFQVGIDRDKIVFSIIYLFMLTPQFFFYVIGGKEADLSPDGRQSI